MGGKIMKIKNIFTTLGLAFAAIGISAGLAHKGQVKEVKADETNYKAFYLDCSAHGDWDGESICLGTWNGTANTYTEATKLQDNYWVVSIDITGLTNIEFYRCKPGDVNTRWNKSVYTEDFATKNLCKVTNWNESGSWSAGEVSMVLKSAADSWQIGTPMAETTNYSETGYAAQWNLLNHDFTADVQMKAVLTINTHDIWLDIGSCGASNLDGIEASKADGNVTINTTAKYNLYVKLGASHQYYFEVLYENEALQFARNFLSHFSTICPNTKNNPQGAAPSAILNQWEDEIDNFNALSDNAQKYLKKLDDYDHLELDQLEELYDYLLGKYTGLTNFLNRSLELSNNTYSYSQANNNTTLIVAVISSLAIVSVLGLFLLKRKQDR